MKYFLAYPIAKDCNLRCFYCYHIEHFISNFDEKQRFSLDQYKKFRDTHLSDAEEIIVHFHGGEPFIDGNINRICMFLKSTKTEKVDILTNGLQERSNYEKILKYKDRIHRIGYTFHRLIIGSVEELINKYESEIMYMHSQGVPVYAKELMVPKYRDQILAYKRYWKEKGINFKIQDFRGTDRGMSRETYPEYTDLDLAWVDSEYKHGGDFCSCMKGYKNVLIRGGWHSGDVLACFEDPKVVGNIQENTYNPNYKTQRDAHLGRINVIGVPEIYRGTFPRDLRTKDFVENYARDRLEPPKGCGSD